MGKKRLQCTISLSSSSKCFFNLRLNSALLRIILIDSLSKFSHVFGKFTIGNLIEDDSLAKGRRQRGAGWQVVFGEERWYHDDDWLLVWFETKRHKEICKVQKQLWWKDDIEYRNWPRVSKWMRKKNGRVKIKFRRGGHMHSKKHDF